ncbi:PREDICTED: myosin heavy chain, cardiac muscle isoform-like [Camelina sativa]|uniref:Myosin heavy chain, cardiac muscle isoform-like n=1 Tax=Camelina sativa TaxID=90675 RepID=A0ABM0Y1H5_CAMSA|nr:PREDICTED: myosin heavy chain, cardiac muscle isoform-like [Camelina sativa]XP_010494035.1 PREDICTED: myosin heavy chain, cardiac muscle isoform-like [Camelina sativa]XP_010494036.1 PREDICTED: myosin heavy chain, cardiac muscle isoform-like [Camelina sativa]
MEEVKVEDEIKLCDLKKENLRKTMEKIKSQASDVLILNLQWCDLEDHLKSAGDKVEKRFRELVSKEVEFETRNFALEERVKVVEAAEAVMGDVEMKANGFRSEIEDKKEELASLRKSLEECNVEHRSKTGQLNELVELLRKTQVDLDLRGEQLSGMVTDLERYRVELNAEKEHLCRTKNDRRELEVELEGKRKALTLVLDKIVECDKLFETRSSELIKTQGEVELKAEQLQQMNVDLERYRVEVSSEKECLARTQTNRKALEEEIEGKNKDLKLVVDEIANTEKLFETRTSEMIKTQGEVESKWKQLEQMNIDLQRHRDEISAEMEHLVRSQTRNRELEEEIERKKKDLTAVLDKIGEYGKQLESVEERLASQQKLFQTRSLELVSKKKELDGLSLDLDLANSLNNEMKEICQQVKSKGKELEKIERLIQERTGHNESIKMLLEEHSEELASKEKKHSEITEEIRKLSLEIVTKEKTIQQLSEKQHSKQNKLDSTEKHLEKSTAEFVSKEKELCAVKDTYRECLQNWEMKEKELKSLQEEAKKIQDSFQSKEAEQVKLKASLIEREKELGMKEKQVRVRSENIERKEKKLDAREERIDKKNEQLKSTEQKLAKCVKDYELEAKKLASFCQQNNPDQRVDLVRDAGIRDEKSLQLVLHGHLRKCRQLHLDVLCALKASSDPAKLVLVTIQELHERTAITKLEPDSVRRSSICLLECLMDMSPEPKTDVQGEAIKSATEWKKTTLVKAENPVAVLGFLHFLAAFSLAYTFDADKVQNLFDAAFLCQYAPSLCEALGVSSLAPVNTLLSSLDDKPEQHPEAPGRNSRNSPHPDVQENIASSDLGNEDALWDPEVSASFSPNEVFTGLQVMTDPAGYVLNLVNDELMGAQQRGELSLKEPIVKHLVSLLDVLPRVVRSSKHLLSDALQVANRWSLMMGNSAQMSPLEAWGFLQLIVAYNLVQRTDRDSTLRFAMNVAHFKQAPKLFESLGLRYAISGLVRQLLDERQYFLAIRYVFYFNLKCSFSPLVFLKEEIINLRRSPKDKRRFDSQAEDRDGAKLREIIELIEEFQLEIDLPVDLIVKFMVPRGIQNQNQYAVSSFAPVQPPQLHMQASHTVIKSSYITTQGSNPTYPTSGSGSPNQQVLDNLETYQAGSSSVYYGQSSHQAGFKRPRMDPAVSRPLIRPCFNPSSYDSRF